MFLVLFAVIFYNQIIKGEKYQLLSKNNSIRIIPQKGSRGRILDRKGEIILDNELSYNVAVLPRKTAQVDKVLHRLSEMLGISFDELKLRYKKNFVSSSLPLTLISNIDRRKAILLEELNFELPGVVIQLVPQRSYAYGNLSAHLLGYLGEIDRWRLTKLKDYGYKTKDTVGYMGIEEKLDYYLRPQDGGLQIEVDASNRIRRVIGFKSTKNGRDVRLTIDLKVQRIVEEALSGFVGAAIIMDPYTGEIIAMASSPSFSPDWFSNRSASVSAVLNDPGSPLLNRCISGVYPAGSVFKVVVAACGLQTKKMNLEKTFFCQGSFKLGRQKFLCWEKHGSQNLIEAIAHSCNVFFYRLGLSLGAGNIHEYALRFGFGRPTQLDLPGEACGFVPSPLFKRLHKFENWYDGDTVNFSIGQGDLLVTPLQIVRMISVFANAGHLVRPYVVKSVDNIDLSKHQRKIVPLALDKEVFNAIKAGLRHVVDFPDGTGHVLQLDYISVAGKTGTAQTPRGQSHAWFSGYFPADKPRFAVCVLLEHGGPGYNACVVTKNIIERMNQEGLL